MNRKLKKHLNNMSVNEKAVCLNLLMREVYPATPLCGEVRISDISQSYNKETNILFDHLIWKLWGIHYKEYLDIIAGGMLIGIDPFKFEAAVERRIEYFLEELYQKGKQTVYKITRN